MSAPYVQMQGLADVMDLSYTFEPGTQPGVCTLVAAVEHVDFSQIVNASTLTILYDHEGAGTTYLQLQDCRVGQVSQSLTGDAYTVTIPVFDRRWRWQYNVIAGWYNRRKADTTDTILSGTEKTPQELAEILLIAMGETAGESDVTAMPNDSRPEMKWDEQTNPAQELQRLCDILGCRIVLQLSNGKVKIYREGVGFGLPYNVDLMQPSYGVVTPIAPSSIFATTAPVWQDRLLQLEAVALDTDNKYKTFDDPDLSYGLNVLTDERFEQDGANLEYLTSTSGWTEDQIKKALKVAASSVYRTYRVIENAYNLDILANIWQLELVNNIGDKDEDDHYKPIEVVGNYYNENLEVEEDWNAFDASVSLDVEKRIVHLSEPAFLLEEGGAADGEMIPAEIYLHCCCKYREDGTSRYLRANVSKSLSLTPWTGGYGELPITIDHLQPIYTWIYTTDTATKTSVSNNLTTMETELNYYANAEAEKYLTTVSGAGSYRGLLLFELDGLRSYVQWSFGVGRPMTTTIALNQRPNNYTLNFKDKVRAEEVIRKQKNEIAKLKAATATNYAVRW